MRIYNAGQTAEAQSGNCAGDRMPFEWANMSVDDVWTGMCKGHFRPAIDVAKAKKMLEKGNRNPDKRFVDDKQADNGKPTFLINENKQQYMCMQWKHDNGPPTAYRLLCGKES